MAQSKAQVAGLVVVLVGGMLVIGAVLFLGATFLLSFSMGVPLVAYIAPVVQIALSLLVCAGGLLLMRGHPAAKLVLVLAAIGIVANVVVLVFAIFAMGTMG